LYVQQNIVYGSGSPDCAGQKSDGEIRNLFPHLVWAARHWPVKDKGRRSRSQGRELRR
jgi:hypothetical protein